VTWIVRVVADAEAEFEAAARWYEERAGLRAEFVEVIDEAIYAIAEGPHRYPPWRVGSNYRKYVVPLGDALDTGATAARDSDCSNEMAARTGDASIEVLLRDALRR
jgi:8-oxo-dGTP pyrophosphatase MutT (NUDIX family)